MNSNNSNSISSFWDLISFVFFSYCHLDFFFFWAIIPIMLCCYSSQNDSNLSWEGTSLYSLWKFIGSGCPSHDGPCPLLVVIWFQYKSPSSCSCFQVGSDFSVSVCYHIGVQGVQGSFAFSVWMICIFNIAGFPASLLIFWICILSLFLSSHCL